jgi:hypothetical protein
MSSDLPSLNTEITESDVIYLVVFSVLLVIIIVCWTVPMFNKLFTPCKLLVVSQHESCHAAAALVSGGSVESIHVDANEGGLTKTRGGSQCLILPAGYLGSNIAGALLIFTARSLILSQICAGLLIASLLGVLFKADSWLTRGIAIGFTAIIALTWTLTILTPLPPPFPPPLSVVLLFLGILFTLYTIFDIYDDLIRRKVRESDASVFASKWPCCPARGYGVIWALVAIAMGGGAVVGSVLLYDTENGSD